MPLVIRVLLVSLDRATLVAIVLAIAAACTSAKAANGSKDNVSAADAALFERLDLNHDESISTEEVTPENQQLFERLVRRGDTNRDKTLSRDEFLAALVPKRPDKPMEAKEPATLPQANAVQYLLLTMDTNRNARIEKDEVPSELAAAYEQLADRLDRDSNGAIERQELSRSGPAVSIMAGRYVDRLGIDVNAKLASLKKTEGDSFDRFDQRPVPLVDIRDPRQARKVFAQFDQNADGKLEPNEVPEPLRDPVQRLIRVADRNDDGKLTESEFVVATERISKFAKRAAAVEKRERRGKSADGTPPKSK